MMRLRERTNKPMRYREVSVELPEKPLFIYEPRGFNPNLRPACFPTLPLDQDYVAESSEVSSPRSTTPSPPALVFRDSRQQEVEEAEAKDMEKLSDNLVYFTGHNLAWEDEEGNALARSPLPGLKPKASWKDLCEGMRLIIVREFTREMSFEDVALFLQIEDDALLEFFALIEREQKRYNDEYLAAERSNELQLELAARLSGGGGYFEEEMEAAIQAAIVPETPAIFKISKRDVWVAKIFLYDLRYKEEFPTYTNPEILSDYDREVYDEWQSLPTKDLWQKVTKVLSDYEGTRTTLLDLDFGPEVFDIWWHLKRERSIKQFPEIWSDALLHVGDEDWYDEQGFFLFEANFPIEVTEEELSQLAEKAPPPPPPPPPSPPNANQSQKSNPAKPINKKNKHSATKVTKNRKASQKKDKSAIGPSRLREVMNASEDISSNDASNIRHTGEKSSRRSGS